LSTGTWAMVTYVIDNTNGQFRLYVNGTLLNTISFSGTPLFMQPGQTLEIGDSSGTEFMNGAIDDLFIYGQALSNSQLASLMNPNVLRSGTNVSVAGGATFDLNGVSATIGSLNGAASGIVTNSNTSAATLTVTGGGSLAGNITGANTALTVAGSAQTLTLSG